MPAQDKEGINTHQNSYVKADMRVTSIDTLSNNFMFTFFYIQNQDGFLNSSFGSK